MFLIENLKKVSEIDKHHNAYKNEFTMLNKLLIKMLIIIVTHAPAGGFQPVGVTVLDRLATGSSTLVLQNQGISTNWDVAGNYRQKSLLCRV